MTTLDPANLARCLRQPRKFDRQRFNEIVCFLRDGLRFVQVSARYNWNFGSCSTFALATNKGGASVDPDDNEAVLILTIYVSERVPLVTSRGLELRTTSNSLAIAASGGVGYEVTASADSKASKVARKLATLFNLGYVEREWLRRIRLNEEDLTEDGRLSLDYSEPDALNILFNEEI